MDGLIPGASRIDIIPDSWTLVGSTKLQFPVNAWEYGTGTEIKRDPGMLFAGYAVALGTLIWLFILLKK